jgi:thiol-disulfide isomerase/thioredoxin
VKRPSWYGIAPALFVVMTTVALAVPATPDAIGILRFADADGRTLALDAPGVLYLVDFWALECKPCMVEMPELSRLAKEYEPSERVRLVSVVYGGWKGEKLRTIAGGAGSGLVMYSDPEDWIARLGIDGYPTKIMIRDGKVLRRARGGGAGAYAKWKAAIDDELWSPRVASPP